MYFFIKFDDDHGASTVEVLKVIKPRAMEARMSYTRTMKFWQICSTREGLQCTNREDDHPHTGLLGSATVGFVPRERFYNAPIESMTVPATAFWAVLLSPSC